MKVAFGGKMGVGKDTAVKYLINKLGNDNCIHVSFAKPIYDILSYAQKITGLKQTKDRNFLQFVVTEWGRNRDEDIWIKLLLKNLKNNEKDNIFLSDMRYENEFELLKKEGWICVKIIRTNVNKNKRKNGGNINHTSETSLENIPNTEWDYIITNNGNASSFYSKLDNLIEKNSIIY